VYVLDGSDQRYQNYAGDPTLFAVADQPICPPFYAR
jgi:hypothetical protein